MCGISIAVLVSISVLIIIQSAVAIRFIGCLRAFHRTEDAPPESLPSAVVVLAVRGQDPFLVETLTALTQQDYPHYAIHVVLDGQVDSGRTVVESVVSHLHATNVTIDVLRNPSASCTLKCSALRQAVGELQTRYDIIAFIDGDTMAHPRWLRDLVVPLQNPAIGVTTGNRWYVPREANWGSLVRYYWNAGAVVQMWLNGIAWAGSMALRTETIRRTDLLDAWGRALSVDNTVCRQIRRHGYRVAFVPGVIALNVERISLPTFIAWVQRQLAGARTSRRNWFVILFHAGLQVGIQLVPVGLAITGLVAGDLSIAGVNGISLLSFWLANFTTAAGIERSIRGIVRLNGGQPQGLRRGLLWKLFPAMLLTFVVYPLALVGAIFCRRVVWRGIEYDVTGRNEVRMVEYRPFDPVGEPGSATSVL